MHSKRLSHRTFHAASGIALSGLAVASAPKQTFHLRSPWNAGPDVFQINQDHASMPAVATAGTAAVQR
jgi:hypothetical protein